MSEEGNVRVLCERTPAAAAVSLIRLCGINVFFDNFEHGALHVVTQRRSGCWASTRSLSDWQTLTIGLSSVLSMWNL